MYRALYRKWRPQRFADVVGQTAIVTALQNQISAGRIGHAYLFTGTRGTGKTTCAKIFAKAVNCLDTSSPDPCGECEICKVGGVATFWKTSGRVLCVGGESLPLGIFQKVQIERQMCQIRPGDLLVMMTDGVLDMMEDGEERMAQVLEGLQEQNPQEIAEKILSYAICASEGRIRDDMTVFVLCLWENT